MRDRYRNGEGTNTEALQRRSAAHLEPRQSRLRPLRCDSRRARARSRRGTTVRIPMTTPRMQTATRHSQRAAARRRRARHSYRGGSAARDRSGCVRDCAARARVGRHDRSGESRDGIRADLGPSRRDLLRRRQLRAGRRADHEVHRRRTARRAEQRACGAAGSRGARDRGRCRVQTRVRDVRQRHGREGALRAGAREQRRREGAAESARMRA